MESRTNLGSIRGTMDLVGWIEAWNFYIPFGITLQSYRTTGTFASLGNMYFDGEGIAGECSG